VGQKVGPGVVDRFPEFGAADEIPFLLFRVAPRSLVVPVPGLNVQLRILAIGDCSPTRRKNLLQQRTGEEPIGVGPQPVYAGAEGSRRTERIGNAGPGNVDNDGLGATRARGQEHDAYGVPDSREVLTLAGSSKLVLHYGFSSRLSS
jgi:hypothetical protein